MKATLELRHAVRPWVLRADARIAVGVSGGADSMALALALAKEAELASIDLVGVIIDHGLQEVTAQVAVDTKASLLAMGFSKVIIKRVIVEPHDGVEASARRARYAAFQEVIDEVEPDFFLLAHTLNDQAEGVLLGLARGSGARSLSGMSEENGIYVRPLLGITRATVEECCNENALAFWSDPHNQDSSYTRVRVRNEILTLMEDRLGPGIAQALARTAALLRADDEALEALADAYRGAHPGPDFEIGELQELPLAIRSRLLRHAIYAQGAPSGSLNAEHLAAVEALVTDWHGQGVVSLPGGVKVARISGRLSLS